MESALIWYPGGIPALEPIASMLRSAKLEGEKNYSTRIVSSGS
jgi:hypothetical protein